MGLVIEAFFDGEVLRPKNATELKPNTSYFLQIEEQPAEQQAKSVWEILDEIVGTVEAPEDWSEEHDHYLYGTPKRKRNVDAS
jgi:Protein of unknown function DUF104.